MFAFQGADEALKRIVLIPLDFETSAKSLVESLAELDVERLSCYNPNDELKIKCIIGAVGRAVFREKIRDMSASMLKAYRRHSNRG
mmetsp:Transcript_25374/g.34875  ORF Transcript_25374/g.34875 Transcript_25374/m.34875 type:complete len:86 (-) Transcript_25374:183-440(-)|eukprot:CAMPEP_0185752458 /NCGR_PEP_ID=MMETSP1174-20130828/11266_1 /TAXON_ID=35687 /ORGANISM="Dictyocha speculum, Strain CCMP1381" /LENGTH=85 /DNA_ID=CAMNT_0028429925 /DNA_START=1321 /DNA_END=1578 /DNA_ORIENTATION=+